MERIDAELELGRHAQLVGELEALVAEHPYQERAAALLMLALYRSGRQAEALEVYRTVRRRLSDELGLQPGQELRDLEAAILRQDDALTLPRQRPSATTPSTTAAAEVAPTRRRRRLGHRRARGARSRGGRDRRARPPRRARTGRGAAELGRRDRRGHESGRAAFPSGTGRARSPRRGVHLGGQPRRPVAHPHRPGHERACVHTSRPDA